MPRAMLVFAHPDDEVIAAGARLSRFVHSHFVHATDGAPRNGRDGDAPAFACVEEYREARKQELDSAFARAGLEHASRESLGYPDQSASRNLVPLTLDVLRALDAFQPEVVFTHPFEGGHPDHDACAFAVQHARALFEPKNGSAPLIIEAPFYHLGPLGMQTGEFLPAEADVETVEHVLSEAESGRKQDLFACFRTQKEMLANFSTKVEKFRTAPAYQFTDPPHAPPLFYDHYCWGLTSAEFCKLAREASAALHVNEAAACR